MHRAKTPTRFPLPAATSICASFILHREITTHRVSKVKATLSHIRRPPPFPPKTDLQFVWPFSRPFLFFDRCDVENNQCPPYDFLLIAACRSLSSLAAAFQLVCPELTRVERGQRAHHNSRTTPKSRHKKLFSDATFSFDILSRDQRRRLLILLPVSVLPRPASSPPPLWSPNLLAMPKESR